MTGLAKRLILIGLDAAVPKLVDEFSGQGRLPNLRLLRRRGAAARALYSIPGVTPVNWTTIATGSHPGTHGITDFSVRLAGEPLDESRNGFRADLIRSETLWEAGRRGGKRCATINYPGAWPLSDESQIWVAGEGSPATGSRFELKSSSCFATAKSCELMKDATRIQFEDLASLPIGSKTAVFELVPTAFRGGGPKVQLVACRASDGRYDEVILKDARNGREWGVLRQGEWSQWLRGRFLGPRGGWEGTFRFKLIEMSPDLERLRLYCSQVMPTDGFASPPALCAELLSEVGPMIENCGTRGYQRGWIDDRTLLEEAEYKGLWLCRAGKYLLHAHDVDLLFIKWHFLDHAQHGFWGGFDPESPWYGSDDCHLSARVIGRAYEIADRMVGEFIEEIDGETLVVVVSDHGHTPHQKAMSVNNLLAKEGLISWRPGPGRPLIDWSNTVAFAGPDVGHIHINLKGRDPGGIVPESDYGKWQDRIIDILYAFKDPANGLCPVQLALRRREAAALGLWGDRVGDVFYLMKAGYSAAGNWSPLTPDGEVLVPLRPDLRVEGEHGQFKFIAPKFQSVHGCSLPSTSLGKGTEEAVFLIAGDGVKQGYRREHPVRLVDIAPTLAVLLGIPVPEHSEGAVLYDLIR
ncbi:MAG: alkaline phosphatase family protein [Bacillota bacterium]